MDASTQDLLTPAAIAFGATFVALLTAALVWFFIKSTANRVVPIGLLLFGFCLEVYFFKQPYIQVGLQIYPNDIISLFVLLAAVVGFAYRPLPINDSPFLLWLAFGVTMIMSFVLGLTDYGRYAGTEVRPFFYMWVAGLYGCVAGFDEADLRRIGRWCVWACYALMAIALYYWIAVETGFVNRQAVFDEPNTAIFRPVGSHGTFFVAGVALVHTMAWLRGTGTRWSGWHAAFFLAFTVIMQHRSVWIAAAVGLAVVFLLERRHLPRRFALMLGFVLTLTLVTAVATAFGFLDELGRRLLESTVTMADDEGTFAARVDGWIRLWESWIAAPAHTLFFGYPFGHGYTRLYNGVVIEFAPHNYYLDLLLRVGIVGTILFLMPTVMAVVHGLRVKTSSEFDYLLARGLGVGLLASLVYFVAYPSYYIIGAATGIALAHLIHHRRTMHARQQALSPVRSPVTGQIIGWRAER
ncbi:MAG: O-antigen ligase family protein [Burkholderiales bacterium]|nr:O-antigen ligase family protein [Burkholderiales bacterium]